MHSWKAGGLVTKLDSPVLQGWHYTPWHVFLAEMEAPDEGSGERQGGREDQDGGAVCVGVQTAG
jgi:hypothetical protein